jgi:hypothetical protein
MLHCLQKRGEGEVRSERAAGGPFAAARCNRRTGIAAVPSSRGNQPTSARHRTARLRCGRGCHGERFGVRCCSAACSNTGCLQAAMINCGIALDSREAPNSAQTLKCVRPKPQRLVCGTTTRVRQTGKGRDAIVSAEGGWDADMMCIYGGSGGTLTRRCRGVSHD